MNIRAIPTTYQGVQFRSRLEARWAAFFDLLGWEWEYEPFDLKGWIPDFLLKGHGALPHFDQVNSEGVLVEVKPCSSFPCPIAEEIDRAGVPDQFEAMIVGRTIPVASSVETSDGYAIGWMKGNPAPWQYKAGMRPIWGDAVCQIFADEDEWDAANGAVDLYHSKDWRLSCDPGFEDSKDYIAPNDSHGRLRSRTSKFLWWGLTDMPRGDEVHLPGAFKCKLLPLWREAGNRVQWRSPRSESTP
jgi:hypothetical protein